MAPHGAGRCGGRVAQKGGLHKGRRLAAALSLGLAASAPPPPRRIPGLRRPPRPRHPLTLLTRSSVDAGRVGGIAPLYIKQLTV